MAASETVPSAWAQVSRWFPGALSLMMFFKNGIYLESLSVK